MNWFKRLFGIKEVEPQGLQIKESYYTLNGISNPKLITEKRMREIVEAERIRRDEIYESSRKKAREDESNFLTSMTVAAVTDSTVAGALVGGDIFGAIVGDALNDSDPTSKDPGFDGGFGGGDFSGGGSGGDWSDSSSNSSDSYDSSSSYDSGSSYDAGSSSSSDW